MPAAAAHGPIDDRRPAEPRPGNSMATMPSPVIPLPVMDDLVTPRLVLHPMTIDEAEQVVAGEPDRGAGWAPGYPDVSGARGFLDRCAQTGDPQPFGNFQIRRREDGCTIGGVGFK